MKKKIRFLQIRFQKQKEQKIYRRRRNRPKLRPGHIKESYQLIHRRRVDAILLHRYENKLYNFLSESGFVALPKLRYKISSTFSLLDNPDNSLEQIAGIHSALHNLIGQTITLNFVDCKKTDLHTLLVLRIIFNEYRASQFKLNERTLARNVISELYVIPSKDDSVNKKLFAAGILGSITTPIADMMPVSTTGIHKGDGTQRHYQENKKGSTATKITQYVVGVCRDRFKCYLHIEAQSEMQALIAEVLNNAEDHGLENIWFATATLFEANRHGRATDDEVIGELSITIMNFGQSFYEGFERTKIENAAAYADLQTMYDRVSAKRGGSRFTKENYFTLFALQDGVSRLKFEQESRGTGTMKFINSFLFLGDYEDSAAGYQPFLSILSGETLLTCNTQYRTFKLANNDYYLSLNDEKSLEEPPSPTCLKQLKQKFPGTVLAVTLYLKKSHLLNKFNSDGNENSRT